MRSVSNTCDQIAPISTLCTKSPQSGYTLSETVKTETIAGHTVHSVADGAFLICLERSLTLDLIRAIAERKPERVLVLDGGFAGNDQLKTNAAQTFKDKSIVFRTL